MDKLFPRCLRNPCSDAGSRCWYQLIPSVYLAQSERHVNPRHCTSNGCRYTLASLDTTDTPRPTVALVLYRSGTCRSQWHRVTPAFPLFLSFSDCRSASSSIDTVSRPYGRARPSLGEIPKANKRSNAKKHLFLILYLTQDRTLFLPSALSFSRARFSSEHTRVLGVPVSRVPRRSRFYCRRKLMRSRGDTTDTTERMV